MSKQSLALTAILICVGVVAIDFLNRGSEDSHLSREPESANAQNDPRHGGSQKVSGDTPTAQGPILPAPQGVSRRSMEELLEIILKERTSEQFRGQTLLPHLIPVEQEFYAHGEDAFRLLESRFDALCRTDENDETADQEIRVVSYLLTQFPQQPALKERLFLRVMVPQTTTSTGIGNALTGEVALRAYDYSNIRLPATLATTTIRCRARLGIMFLEQNGIGPESMVAEEASRSLRDSTVSLVDSRSDTESGDPRIALAAASVWISTLYYFIAKSESVSRSTILKWGESLAKVVMGSKRIPYGLIVQLTTLYQVGGDITSVLDILSSTTSLNARTQIASQYIGRYGFRQDEVLAMWLACSDHDTAKSAAFEFAHVAMDSYSAHKSHHGNHPTSDETIETLADALRALVAAPPRSDEARLWMRMSAGFVSNHSQTYFRKVEPIGGRARERTLLETLVGRRLLRSIIEEYFGVSESGDAGLWDQGVLAMAPYLLESEQEYAQFMKFASRFVSNTSSGDKIPLNAFGNSVASACMLYPWNAEADDAAALLQTTTIKLLTVDGQPVLPQDTSTNNTVFKLLRDMSDLLLHSEKNGNVPIDSVSRWKVLYQYTRAQVQRFGTNPPDYWAKLDELVAGHVDRTR